MVDPVDALDAAAPLENETPHSLTEFFKKLNRLQVPVGRGPKGAGLTRERVRLENQRADQRSVLSAMRREYPDTEAEETVIERAEAKRAMRRERNQGWVERGGIK